MERMGNQNQSTHAGGELSEALREFTGYSQGLTLFLFLLAFVGATFSVGCGRPWTLTAVDTQTGLTEASPTPEPTPEVSPTPSISPAPAPTATPFPSAAPTPTPSPTPTPTATPSPTPTAAPTPTPTPTCVPGTELGIYKDTNKDGNPEDAEYQGKVASYVGDYDPVTNYNYYSASAHPLVGPSPLGYAAHVFFYQKTDSQDIAMTFFFNKDEEGSPDNIVEFEISTLGNYMRDSVLFLDDPNSPEDDWITLTQNAESVSNVYRGHVHYWSNTDGAVVGPFSGEEYIIKMSVTSAGDIRESRFYSADGSSFSLVNDSEVFTPFIIKFRETVICSK